MRRWRSSVEDLGQVSGATTKRATNVPDEINRPTPARLPTRHRPHKDLTRRMFDETATRLATDIQLGCPMLESGRDLRRLNLQGISRVLSKESSQRDQRANDAGKVRNKTYDLRGGQFLRSLRMCSKRNRRVCLVQTSEQIEKKLTMSTRGSRGAHARDIFDFTPRAHSKNTRRVCKASIAGSFKRKPHQSLRVW